MLLRSAQIFLAAEEVLRSIDAIGVKAVETAVRSTRTRIAQDLETVISSRPAEIREHAAKVRGISEDGQQEVYFAAATKLGSALSELKGIRAQVADAGDEQTSKRVELLEQAL